MADNVARKLIEFCSGNKCPNHKICDLCMYETGVKDFAKFLICTKEHTPEAMQYWVDTFLEKGE